MYNDLFKIERDAKEPGVTGDQLKLMREQEAKPILDKMKEWLDHAIMAFPKSSFGKAMFYCNLAEQEMKRVAINRKNSSFFGSDKGGEDAEIFMSLISTCRRNNIDPFAYLTHVVKRLTESPEKDPHFLVPHMLIPRIRNAEIQGGVSDTKKMILAATG
ncbi:MAG: transposase domain-containing protein [Candidatus Obscuribacterales bacterium]|nr:transposase domain-containing protein [Candidatus Obscuribacterales bacterium]